jgi:Effector protein
MGWQGKSLAQGKVLDMGEFVPFRDRIVVLLEKIRATNTGVLLFQTILKTGKTVRIHTGDDWDDNAAKMDPNISANGVAAAVKPFRPAHYNVELTLKGNEKAWRGQDIRDDRSVQKAQIKAQMATLGQATHKAETAPVLKAVLNRTHLGMNLDPQITNNRFINPMTQLPQRLNISANDFDDMVNAMRYMPDAVYYPLCFLLYDYMLPGAGTDTQVRVMNAKTFEHDFNNDLQSESKMTRGKQETAVRLDAVVLAHELIHAWRMMSGRRIVSGGWEEEAMTSGIGPFSSWRMTENSFRSDLGLKQRRTYANSRHSSERIQTLALK